MGWRLISSLRRRADEARREDRMARAPHVNSAGRRPRDRAASARGPLLLWAAVAALVLTRRPHAQTPRNLPPTAPPPAQNFAHGNPSPPQQAMQDAIPVTPSV